MKIWNKIFNCIFYFHVYNNMMVRNWVENGKERIDTPSGTITCVILNRLSCSQLREGAAILWFQRDLLYHSLKRDVYGFVGMILVARIEQCALKNPVISKGPFVPQSGERRVWFCWNDTGCKNRAVRIEKSTPAPFFYRTSRIDYWGMKSGPLRSEACDEIPSKFLAMQFFLVQLLST
jgi:hypothetical protein